MSDDAPMSGDALMSDEAPSCDVRIPRRRFLSKLGVAGLAASAGLFANVSTAEAASCGCCNLVWCPPTTDYGTCVSYSHYLWGCTTSGGFLYCNCCERKNAQGQYIASAYRCQYP
jgi:hypothetical protein